MEEQKRKSGVTSVPPEITHPIPAEQHEIKKEQESLEQIPAPVTPEPELPESPPEVVPKKPDQQ
jgi:hypothetical protein